MRSSTRRRPRRRKNGSCRVERLRPFHWPRRASFLTDPNIANINVGHQDAKAPLAVPPSPQRGEGSRGGLTLGPPPARLIILISLDNRLDQRVPYNVLLAEVNDGDA